MGKRVDRKDVDINQKGVSPQVKVEQQGPDGKAAGGKTAAKPGTITGPVGKADEEKDDEDEHGIVGGAKSNSRSEGGKELKDDDEEEEKKDDDDEEHDDADAGGSGMAPSGLANDYDAGAGTGAAGAAMGPIDRMKSDLDEIRNSYKDDPDAAAEKMDALEGKLDAFAASSMGKNEKRGDSKGGRVAAKKSSETFTREQMRARVRLERQAEKLVPYETAQKFDSMSDDEIRAACIKHHAPNAELKGKSSTYLEARFDSLSENFEDESASEVRRDAGRRMLGLDGEGNERMDGAEEVDPGKSRLKMVQTGREEWKQPLSASKK